MKQGPLVRLLIAFSLFIAPIASASEVGSWHGVNITSDITDAGLDRIHAIGFNVVRLSMNRQPLMQKQPPYDFDEAALAHMKAIVEACHARGLKVILDPHTTPGTERATTTLGSDPIWRDRSLQQLLVKLWTRISKDYAANPTVVGYDLLNEPTIPGGRFGSAGGDGMSWNELAADLVYAVRQNDHKTTIIIESYAERSRTDERNRFDSLQIIKLPPDGNIALSIHAYLPKQFTGQGVHDNPMGIQYPGTIDGQTWDRATLEARMKPVQEFANAHHVDVFVGEFSASRFGDPVSTSRYLGDLVSIFNEFGWGWAYHAYGPAYAWSLEDVDPPAGKPLPQAVVRGSTPTAPSRVELFRSLLKAGPAR